MPNAGLAGPLSRRKRNKLILALVVSAIGTGGAVASGFASTAEATSYRWSRGESAASSHPATTILDSATTFTPLLLSAHVPEKMKVSWSCNLQSPEARTPHVVVATQLGRAGGDGLIIRDDGKGAYHLVVRGQLLTTLPYVDQSRGSDCVHTALFSRSGFWTVQQDDVTVRSGTVDPPAVTGIVTELEPGQLGEGFVELDLITVPHGPSKSGLRSILRLGSMALTLVAVVLLLNLDGRSRPSKRAHHTARVDGTRWVAVDHLFVATTLAAWWLVGPVQFDDGWVLARVTNFASDDVFGSFYDTFNAPLPLGYLHDLMMAGFSSISHSLLWLRVPSVMAGIVTWIFVRSAIDSVSRPGSKPSRWGHPAAAAMFLLSWISWNGTLRPEPLVALIVAISLWASMRFIQRKQMNYILLAALASALAISIHPAGIVCLAPVVVALPALARELRLQRFAALLHLGTVTLIGLSVLVVALGSVGDYHFWASATNSFRAEVGHSANWWDESTRYAYLFGDDSSSSTRRLSVLLPLVSAVMFFLRRRGDNGTSDTTHVGAFLVGTAMLALTPSKWFWHFGTLAPLAAVCVGIEASTWKGLRLTLRPEWVRLLIPLVMAVLVNAIGWRGGFGWNAVALIELEPTNGPLAGILGLFANPWVLTFVLALFCVGLTLRLRQRASNGDALKLAVARVGANVIPATAVLAIGVSVAAFSVDALLLSPDWSLPRQNIEGLTQTNCGLADQIGVRVDQRVIPGYGAASSTIPLQTLIDLRGGTVLVAPHIRMYFPCVQQPIIRDGVAEIPSIVVATGGWPVGLPGNPHHLLPDVAEFTTVAQVFVSPNYSQTIDVALVDVPDGS